MKLETVKYVESKILEQGGPCTQSNSSICLYQSGPKRCAVGWLFTDEELERIKDSGYNYVALSDLPNDIVDRIYEEHECSGKELLELQGCHDRAADRAAGPNNSEPFDVVFKRNIESYVKEYCQPVA